MEGRSLSYFAADVHLGLEVGDMKDREARFVAFLKSIPADRTAALYLLGDIWDFWYEYRDVVPRGYVGVFAALKDLMDAGVEVWFFTGNHDTWTYGYFAELGMKVIKNQPFVTEIGGQVFCLGHGDGLGGGMKLYKLMKWGFNNRFFQWLFSLLHPWIAYRLGKGWSRNSRLAKNIPYVFKGAEEPLYRYCESMASRRRIDHFIFGHFHTSVRLTLPSGSDFIILKDWIGGDHYAVFDGERLDVV